jgi:hypothetical protein
LENTQTKKKQPWVANKSSPPRLRSSPNLQPSGEGSRSTRAAHSRARSDTLSRQDDGEGERVRTREGKSASGRGREGGKERVRTTERERARQDEGGKERVRTTEGERARYDFGV